MKTGGVIRLALVSEVQLHREGLAAILDGRGGIRVVGTARAAAEAIAMVAGTRPDVLLLDLAPFEGLSPLRSIAASAPGLGIVVAGVPDRPGDIIACIESGAMGYLTREASLEDVVLAVGRVADGEAACSPQVSAVLIGRLRALAGGRGTAEPAAPARLTARETEIATLIDRGLSNREIAVRLCIETATVKNHVHSLLKKLHARSRGEAAARLRTQH